MTDPTVPAYPLTGLTDKQWAAQLASQEKMKRAELEIIRETREEERLHHRELVRGRREMINMILGALAVLVAFLTVIGSIYFGVQRSDERQHDLGVKCVQSGGVWEEHDGRDGDRCRRP
jgi:hypothetical protein